MEKIKVRCPAKINLTLKILNRRQDGFHNIDSVMQTISLYDYLTISALKSDRTEIKLSGTSDEIPYNEKNLVHKAATLFLDRTGINAEIEIYIEKNIPVAAGLAGGSTDAAGTLFGLNEIFMRPLSRKDLHELCAALGSDLNLCLEGGRQKTSGRGEILEQQPFEEFTVSLIKPKNLGISAKEAYTKFAAKQQSPHLTSPTEGGGINIKPPESSNKNPQSKNLTLHARQLRKAMTEAEKILWYYLQKKQFHNLKFQRQQIIGNYIVDFICFEKKLIIELDGGQHNETNHMESDKKRDEFLQSQGFKIIRIWNNDIFENIDSVLEYLEQIITDTNIPPHRRGRLGGGVPHHREEFLNDLEWAVIDDYEELQVIKNKYPDSVMSGSGSTYFLLNGEFAPVDGFWVKNNLKSVPFGVTVV